MKKMFTVGITLLTTLSLAACGNTTKNSSTTKKDTSSVVQKKKAAKKASKASSKVSSSTASTSSSVTSSTAETVSSSSDSAGSSSVTANSTGATATSSSAVNAASSSSESIRPITFDEASALIQKGGFTDFNADSAKQSSRGSHQTAGGGFEMDTYPGARGRDIFTLTPHSDGSVFITAQYGSLQGGFTLLEDQSFYGPSSATVQR